MNEIHAPVKALSTLVIFILVLSSSCSRAPDIGGLLKDLKDEDSRIRTRAVRELARVKDAHAVDPLIEALKDKESDVR